MPTTEQAPDSHQHTETMLEEKLDMIAQIEEDWLKIDDGCSDSNTHDSTSVKSGESDGLHDLKQGEIPSSDETIEDEHHDKSSDNNTHDSTSVDSGDSEELQDLEHCELLPWDETIKIQPHDKNSDNNTQDSTQEKPDGPEVLEELEQGDLSTSGDSNEDEQHGRGLDNNTQDSTPENPGESEGLDIELSGISMSVETIEDHQHDKSFTPDSLTTVHQVWYRYGKTSVAPIKRGLDENGNLIPLPPATPPLEVSNSHDLPLGLVETVVISSAIAVASSSKPTVSSASVHGGRKRPADHSWSVGASPRRPYRISKAWKTPGDAGVSLGVKDGAKSGEVTKCIMNEPGDCASQDTVDGSRETEDQSEIADVAGLDSIHDVDKPVEEDENMPVTGNPDKTNVGNDNATNVDVEAGNMDAQPREDIVPSDVAENTVSETDDPVNEPNDRAQDSIPETNYLAEGHEGMDSGKGLDSEAGNINGHPSREGNAPGDVAANNVPKTDDSVKVIDGMDNTQVHDADAGNVDVEHSREGDVLGDVADKDVPETDDLVEEPGEGAKNNMPEIDNHVERHDRTNDGFGTEATQTDDQYPGVDSADAAMKPGHTIGNGVPKTNDLVEGSDEIDIDAEHPRVDNVDEVQKPSDTAGNEVPKGADMPILNGGSDTQQPSEAASSPEEEASNIVGKDQSKTADMLIHNGALEIQQSEVQEAREDNSGQEVKAGNMTENGVPNRDGMLYHHDAIEDDRWQDVHNGGMGIQQPKEDDSGNEGNSSVVGGSVVPELDDSVEIHDDVQGDEGNVTNYESIKSQHPGEIESEKEEDFGILVGKVVPEKEVMSEESEDINSDKVHDIKVESMVSQCPPEDHSAESEKSSISRGSDMLEMDDINDVPAGSEGDEAQCRGEDDVGNEGKPNNTTKSDMSQTDEIVEERDLESDEGLDVESVDMDPQPFMDSLDNEEGSGDRAINDDFVEKAITEEYAPTTSDEASAISKEDTEGRHPYIIEGARVLDLVRDFANRGLALYMSARGCDEQEELGEGSKEVDPKAGCNHQTVTEQGLDLLMEAMSGSIGI